jgi:hypothetical protein
MTVTHDGADLERDLVATAMRAQRSSLLYTAVATVVIAGLVGGFLYYSVDKLASVNDEIAQKSVALSDTSAKLVAAQHVLKESGGQLEIVTAKLDRSQIALRLAENELASNRTELDTIRKQLADTTTTLDDTQKRLDAAEEQLRHSTDIASHVRPLDLGDVKMLAGRFGKASRYLIAVTEISQSPMIRWGLANTPAGGFTSPGFAQFILQRTGSPNVAIESLPVREGPPHPGDLIRYYSGYTLFYFPATDAPSHAAFVIGMTPYGVGALTPDFGVPRIDVRITPQSD